MLGNSTYIITQPTTTWRFLMKKSLTLLLSLVMLLTFAMPNFSAAKLTVTNREKEIVAAYLSVEEAQNYTQLKKYCVKGTTFYGESKKADPQFFVKNLDVKITKTSKNTLLVETIAFISFDLKQFNFQIEKNIIETETVKGTVYYYSDSKPNGFEPKLISFSKVSPNQLTELEKTLTKKFGKVEAQNIMDFDCTANEKPYLSKSPDFNPNAKGTYNNPLTKGNTLAKKIIYDYSKSPEMNHSADLKLSVLDVVRGNDALEVLDKCGHKLPSSEYEAVLVKLNYDISNFKYADTATMKISPTSAIPYMYDLRVNGRYNDKGDILYKDSEYYSAEEMPEILKKYVMLSYAINYEDPLTMNNYREKIENGAAFKTDGWLVAFLPKNTNTARLAIDFQTGSKDAYREETVYIKIAEQR